MGKAAEQMSDVHEQCCVSTKLKSRVTPDSWCLTSGQPCWSPVTSALRDSPQRLTINLFQCSNVQKIKKKKLIEKTSLLLLPSCGSPGNRVKTRWPGAVAGETQKERGREHKLLPVSGYSLRLVDWPGEGEAQTRPAIRSGSDTGSIHETGAIFFFLKNHLATENCVCLV